jgi:Sulfotransferase family
MADYIDPVETQAHTQARAVSQAGPVFVFSIHRSGGTLLGRILNCHPDLVIWGEHAGIINKLADLNEIIRLHPPLTQRKGTGFLERFLNEPTSRTAEFNAWTNPLDCDLIRTHLRQFIESMFARNLRPGQRWGFKEIRYHSLATAIFLHDLFPTAAFVFLSRDLPDAAVSNILAPWSLDRLPLGPDGSLAREIAEVAIDDVVYALLCIEKTRAEIQDTLPGRCFNLNYRALRSQNFSVIFDMFRFLELDIAGPVLRQIDGMWATPVSPTDKAVRYGGILDAAFIQERVAQVTPSLSSLIENRGVDRTRLAAKSGVGRFSGLIGDHHVMDTKYSSMF